MNEEGVLVRARGVFPMRLPLMKTSAQRGSDWMKTHPQRLVENRVAIKKTNFCIDSPYLKYKGKKKILQNLSFPLQLYDDNKKEVKSKEVDLGNKTISNYTQMTDEALCELIKTSKSKSAVKEIYRRYSVIIDYWLRELSFRGDRDDLKQEAFIAVFGALEAFNPSAGVLFSTYAKKCVENRWKSYFRQKGQKGFEFMEPDAMASIPEEGPSVLDKMDDVLEVEQILDALHLTQREREVLVKKYGEQKMYVEIARELGIDTKQVDNILYHIRRKFRIYREKIRREDEIAS